MKLEEFRTLIESIGFKLYYDTYEYKEFRIYLYTNDYNFYNGSKCEFYYYTDLRPELLKLSRSIKLKTLLR